MKPLLKNHYIIMKQRGLIHAETTIDQFIENLNVQYSEVLNCYADDINSHRTPSDDLVQEITELMLIITDLAQHYNLDLTEQIGKSNRRQENLISRLTFTV